MDPCRGQVLVQAAAKKIEKFFGEGMGRGGGGEGGELLAINVKDSLPLKGQRNVDRVEQCK